MFGCMSLKDELVKVENADTYTIANVSRDTTGEYKCSLIDNPTMEASKDITVKCKRPKHVVFLEKQRLLQFLHTPLSL